MLSIIRFLGRCPRMSWTFACACSEGCNRVGSVRVFGGNERAWAGHHADDNNEKTWTQTEVQAKLTEAREAFQNWKVVQ